MLTVALIGRTNVGKSSLFNRMIGEAKAITAELPHTTRDRLTGTTMWRGVDLRAIDTGGVEELHPTVRHRRTATHPATIEAEIRAQAERAVGEADVLVLVIDARDGVLPGERTIARSLRAFRKPVIVACNKAETAKLRLACGECAELGFGDATPTSAVTGSGVGDLLDRIVEFGGGSSEVGMDSAVTDLPVSIKIAIVGEPNVGKSSLVNAILGREEVIVTPEPFTTRDVHDVEAEYDGQTVVLLDTAGIRRLAVRAVRTHRTRLETIERLAVSRSLRAIERADVVCLVLDAMRSASRHVKQLAQAIVHAGRACMIVVNKVDLVPPVHPNEVRKRVTRRGSDATETASELTHETIVRRLLPHLSWAPLLSTSATTDTGVNDILPTALAAAAAWRRTLSAPELATAHAETKRRIPTARTRDGRRRSDLVELQQTGTTPPRFLLRTRKRVRLPAAIPAIVERTLRETFDFTGTPIQITTVRTK